MTRIIALLGCLLVAGSCARPRGGMSAGADATDTLVVPRRSSDVYIPPGQHGPGRGPPAIILVVDSAFALIDTTTRSQLYRDSLLATVTGRIITRVRMYPPRDTTAVKLLGSLAQNGVLWIETRAF